MSRVTEVLWEKCEGFSQRSLDGYEAAHLFAGAVYEPLRRPRSASDTILVTRGIQADGFGRNGWTVWPEYTATPPSRIARPRPSGTSSRCEATLP